MGGKSLVANNSYVKQVLTLMTGTALAQIIVFISSAYLARIYTAEDFGNAAVFISITTMISTFIHARYEQAILLPKFSKHVNYLVHISMMIGVTLSIILLVLIGLLDFSLSTFYGRKVIETYYYLLPLSGFLVGSFNLYSNVANKVGKFKLIANTNLVKALFLVTLQIAFGWMGFSEEGLIFGTVASFLVGVLCFIYFIGSINFRFATNYYTKYLALAKKFIDFPKYQVFHAVINSFSASLPIYSFQLLFSSAVVGYYSMSLKLIIAPLFMISEACSRVYTKKVTELVNTKSNSLDFTVKYLFLMVKIFALPSLAFIYFLPDIFSFVLGDEWYTAGVYSQILFPWIVMVFINSTITHLPNILNLQKKALTFEMYNFVLRVIAIVIGGMIGDEYMTLALFSMVGFLMLIYRLSWIMQALKKHNSEVLQ
ncbi:oligosaccharide flippase family protein [Vibrio mediterranei]|uniref:oligosaccharide flippase family protein n=1 Tax=Vibrio mediterranei TaxID=689 RepID=UPI0022848C6A|nr:oligosaccharide flippase family protein [Vibrio mediterranei]MCY9853646.1 oligosaccharide flippase family protein [Vibrio mediterranei]